MRGAARYRHRADRDRGRQRPARARLPRCARARGLRCPEEVSIIGFNDMPFIDRLLPPLTSVRIPQREIGTVAAGLLLERLARPERAGARDPARAHADRAGLDGAAPRASERVDRDRRRHAHVIVSELLGEDGAAEAWRPRVRWVGDAPGRSSSATRRSARPWTSSSSSRRSSPTSAGAASTQRCCPLGRRCCSAAAPMPQALERCRLQNAGLARMRAQAPDRVSVLGRGPAPGSRSPPRPSWRT